jgi:hypothetical protein
LCQVQGPTHQPWPVVGARRRRESEGWGLPCSVGRAHPHGPDEREAVIVLVKSDVTDYHIDVVSIHRRERRASPGTRGRQRDRSILARSSAA